MRIIEDVRIAVEAFPNTALTIGSFDGVHLGHRRIIGMLVAAARKMDGTAALIVPRPHPRRFFAPDNPPNLITSDGQKEDLLAEAGVDVLYVLPFDRETAQTPARTFFEEVIVKRCQTRVLIAGHDFSFGKNAEGNTALLEQWTPDFGIGLQEAPPLFVQGERVSSTLIRERILEGEVEHVECLLGRKYAIRGRVESGRGIGRTIGFPTANLLPGLNVLPAQGVYAARARVFGQEHVAAVNIGVAPTLGQGSVTIEAHLLDFEGALNGETLEIEFHKRLRPEKKFSGLPELVAAIAADVAEIRAFFA